MNVINTVLVANRGEIACRIMRTLKAQGITSVAVYSDADATAPHVTLADQAICIGAAPVSESYLNANAIIQAAISSHANAIHPGYGFLSENAEFAQLCADHELIFIGPSIEAIEVMGNKAESKRRMLAANVPCIPGYQGQDQADATLQAAADEIGYPIMVKAAAGGGGRGMRLVQQSIDILTALERARSEALNAFGSAELILEKAVLNARHVEIQVFADNAGHTIHLGERDCSVQRRHQKVLEEAPCPAMTTALREAMGAAAVNVAKAVQYSGAGTVEFLLADDGQFYFLEMNTRLQVEHPVTECVTGLDLVALQLQVANNHALGLQQHDVTITGHAIEARLYAEDPAADFLPATGFIEFWQEYCGAGIRIDSGISSGQPVSPFYDPMLAKVIASGETRDIARRRLITALQNMPLHGPKTNKSFLIKCLQQQDFANGVATTTMIDQQLAELVAPAKLPNLPAIAAVLLGHLQSLQHCANSLLQHSVLLGWTNAQALHSRFELKHDEQQTTRLLLSTTTATNSYTVQQANQADVVITLLECATGTAGSAKVAINGQQFQLYFSYHNPQQLWLSYAGVDCLFTNTIGQADILEHDSANGLIRAPMHGVILAVNVAAKQTVTQGQTIAVLEAMKMQHEILSPVDGIVNEISTSSGQQVATDDLLISITPNSDSETID